MSDVTNVMQIKTHKCQLIFLSQLILNSQNLNKLSTFNKQSINKEKQKENYNFFSLMLRNALDTHMYTSLLITNSFPMM